MVERINKLSSRRITLLPIKSKFITKGPSSLTISISTIKNFPSFIHGKTLKEEKKKTSHREQGQVDFLKKKKKTQHKEKFLQKNMQKKITVGDQEN